MEYENIRIPISVSTSQMVFLLLYLIVYQKKVNVTLERLREKQQDFNFRSPIYFTIAYRRHIFKK